jgi:hypothetical protein
MNVMISKSLQTNSTPALSIDDKYTLVCRDVKLGISASRSCRRWKLNYEWGENYEVLGTGLRERRLGGA